MQSSWNIKPRGVSCSKTGRRFEDGEVYFTLLYREADGFRREDICEQAWNERNENIQPFSFWRGKFEAAPPPAPEVVGKDDAEGMLRAILAKGDAALENAAYILALMLERKKILIPQQSSDSQLLVYEHSKTGETIVVRNPALSFEQIPDVQRQVSQLLAGGLPA